MNVMLSSISRHARWNLFWLVTICVSLAFTACSNDDDPVSDSTDGKEYTGSPLVILDTDIGSSTDDLFAMQMLYRYADEGKCKFLGVVVDRQGEDYAALADVMNTYFGYPDLPIGLERHGILNFSPWGVVTFHPDATTTFVANPAGRHRYQEPGILKWSEDMLQKIRVYTMIR